MDLELFKSSFRKDVAISLAFPFSINQNDRWQRRIGGTNTISNYERRAGEEGNLVDGEKILQVAFCSKFMAVPTYFLAARTGGIRGSAASESMVIYIGAFEFYHFAPKFIVHSNKWSNKIVCTI